MGFTLTKNESKCLDCVAFTEITLDQVIPSMWQVFFYSPHNLLLTFSAGAVKLDHYFHDNHITPA